MTRSRLIFGRLKKFVRSGIGSAIPLGHKPLQATNSLRDLARLPTLASCQNGPAC